MATGGSGHFGACVHLDNKHGPGIVTALPLQMVDNLVYHHQLERRKLNLAQQVSLHSKQKVSRT